MKSFFRNLLASVLGVMIAFFLIFLIMMGVVGSLVSSQENVFKPKKNSILHLKMDVPIIDRAQKSPFEDIDLGPFQNVGNTGLDKLLKNIEKASADENIEGIFLDVSIIPSGLATIEEIRNSLKSFKDSGKFIIATADIYSQTSYYLASVANEVYLTPEGTLPFVGLSAEVVFIKNMLDKIGLNPQIIRHGKFKAAIEPLTREDLSDENRQQIRSYISSLWNHMIDGIAEGRSIPSALLNTYADELTIIKDSDMALEHKMVDGLIYRDEILEKLRDLTEVETIEDFHMVSLSKYENAPEKRKFKGLARDKIAVVYALGDVVMGDTEEGTIGSVRISRAIREARQDSSIKAIVLRVNSGGGSGLASGIIEREVQLAAKAKPVIASFGDVAASGGYYIAASADTILASPTTITGSIGVFGLFMTGKELMNEKLGITSDIVKTNEHADLGSFFRPLDQEEKQTFEYAIEDFYETFITVVANGRGMSKEQVDEIAQGRVYTGLEALEIGLIDGLGGLEDAIQIAADITGLDHYRVVGLPELKDPIEELLEGLNEGMTEAAIEKELKAFYPNYKQVRNLMHADGIQARMPYIIDIK